jgi:hypothetical protein
MDISMDAGLCSQSSRDMTAKAEAQVVLRRFICISTVPHGADGAQADIDALLVSISASVRPKQQRR